MPRHPAGWLVEEQLTQSAIGAFFAVHKALSFGFLEKVYSRAIQVELEYRGHHVVREYPVTITYRGVEIGDHRLDLLVDNKLVLESKATEQLPRDFTRQLYNYLKVTSFEVGLLLHFGRRADFYRIVYQNNEGVKRE
jgi:GxxExxY protein